MCDVVGKECDWGKSDFSKKFVCSKCVDGSKFIPNTMVIGKINQQVIKESGKPFKSGNTVNTIKGYMPHPYLINEQAYTFYEDDSYVEIRRCIIVEGGTKMLTFDIKDKDINYLKNMMKDIEDLKELVSKKILILSSTGSFEDKFNSWLEHGIKEDLPWISSAGQRIRDYLVEERDFNRYENITIDRMMDWIYDDEDYCTWDDEGEVSTFTEAGIELLKEFMEHNVGSVTIDW